MNRRDILKYSLISAVASTFVTSASASESKDAASKVSVGVGSPAPIPATKGPRVVVVGGGWSGLSVAKYTKKFAPNADVVLVERRSEFISCPVSNLYVVGEVGLEFLTHDYLQAARENKYSFFNATAVDVDKTNK